MPGSVARNDRLARIRRDLATIRWTVSFNLAAVAVLMSEVFAWGRL